MKKLNQKGFGVVEVLVVIVIVGLVGVVGWLVYDQQTKTDTKDSSQTTEQTSQNDASSSKESTNTVDGLKYNVPTGWKNAGDPFESSESGEGHFLLSPDYKEAGGGQLLINSGAFISFQNTEWVDIKSNINAEQAVDILKGAEGSYLDPDSVKITTVGGKQVVMFDAGHTTDGVTVLYKTTGGQWLEANFSTIAGEDSEYKAQESAHYQTFVTWLEEFVKLN